MCQGLWLRKRVSSGQFGQIWPIWWVNCRQHFFNDNIWIPIDIMLKFVRAATSTDFRNRLTGPPNSNRIRLTERFASPYGALCFHVFTDSDSPLGPSRLSLQVVSLLVSNQTSFMQTKWRSKIITCGVLMHKNKSLTWCYSPVSSRIKQGKESCYSNLHNQR